MDSVINIVFILLIAWFIISKFLPVKGVRQMSTDELKKELRKDAHFIDVRTPGEFQNHHIKGFKNIPLHELKKRHHEISKDKETILICQSGMRSMKASKILKKLGYTRLANVRGGMNVWKA